ncbi:heme-binding domain-containing protein [Chitinophaga defluvii]|uniref:Heme-binding domain-containing protein n=1 Tax=Chitinophaga defluvii TaxID=3163343 RepID=A0ABV2T1A6_9BACT
MRGLKIGLLLLLVVFLLAQFFTPAKNNGQEGGSEDITHVYAVPADVQVMLKSACYDCHSNNTAYPWYTYVQPVGWMMAAHVKEGKATLNFDTYGTYTAKRQRNKLKSIREQIIKGKMPLKSYTLMHGYAKFTAAQKDRITKWIDSTLTQNSGPVKPAR